MRGEQIVCSKCNRTFDSAQIKLKKQRRPDGVTEVYYHCPKCQNRYIVCLHSDETLGLQRRINRLDLRGKVNVARKLRLELKMAMDTLNSRS